MDNTEKFEGWAIVEMLGHKRLAGLVSEATIAGTGLLRVDVPETDHRLRGYVDGQYRETPTTKAGFTTYVAPGSLYRLTPTSEEVAREAARQFMAYDEPLPITMPRPQLPPTTVRENDEQDSEFEVEEEELPL